MEKESDEKPKPKIDKAALDAIKTAKQKQVNDGKVIRKNNIENDDSEFQDHLNTFFQD